MCNKNCFNCPYPDCTRDERQDDRDRINQYRKENKDKYNRQQRDRYHNNLDKSREYHRNYARKNYNTSQNTEMCKKWRNKNIEKKRQYDRERYLRLKVN